MPGNRAAVIELVQAHLSAQEACNLFWRVTTVREHELLGALRQVCNTDYEDKNLFLRADPLLKAIEKVVAAHVQKEDPGVGTWHKAVTELLSAVLAASRPDVETWLNDLRINGAKHPELWKLSACFCSRVLRGEIVEHRSLDEPHVSFDKAKSSLLEALSPESPPDQLWHMTWARQCDLLRNALASSPDPAR